MLGTGIILALFIGVGVGLMLYNPLGIGMLTGFIAKDNSCRAESTELLKEQEVFITAQDTVSQTQDKLNALTQKIDSAWNNSQKNTLQGKSNKEDLLLLQDYYRQKTSLEKNLFSAKESVYDSKNDLSQAQENIKRCIDMSAATARTTSLEQVASHAVSVNDTNTLQSNLLGSKSTTSSVTHSSAKPQITCKVPGSVKSCAPLTQNGKTCKAYQECGTDLILSGCKVSPVTCQ